MTELSRTEETARRKKLEEGELLAAVELYEGDDKEPSVVVQYWRSQEGQITARSAVVALKMWTMEMRLPLNKRGRPSAAAIRDSLVQVEVELQEHIGEQEPAS
ncbi:hypothetical protein [Thiomonas sp.]